MKYFFSILFLISACFNLFGQASRYAPTAVKLGVDPGTLGYMIFSEKRGFFEVEGDIDIDRFFVVANYGLSNYKLSEETYVYENNGSYLRLGADINFMQRNPHLNVALFGLRYVASSFNDKLDYDTRAVIHSQTGWPNTRETISNPNAKANWYEMVTGLKIRVVKQLYMGFTLRFKFLMKIKGTKNLRPYYVPGFGKNINTSAFGFNYYISYRLPFRKKIIYTDSDNKVIEEKKK
ncbi:MAG: hypothetical protein KAI99_07110 [Cyclobacteriaceae bacterium]|nr:hypothetical protein [Cyclobacteriaceae bacterium]